MKLILYSNPANGILEKLENQIFPEDKKVIFGYMPADGRYPKPEYTPFWRDLALKHGAEFIYIDNSKKPDNKFKSINSLAIMGGNSFVLLNNLRKNGYDTIIKKMVKNELFVYSGFSAGAIIATPDIRIAGKQYGWSFGYDENNVGIKNTQALGLVDFEILPHYDKALDEKKLRVYENKYKTEVKPLSDADYIIINS